MGKVIRQILVLLWKVLKLVLWRWLRQRLPKILLFTALIGLFLFVVVVLGRL